MPWEAYWGFLAALVALYSPVAAAPSYSPIIGHFDPATRRRLAVLLTVIVAVFVTAAVWVGELVLNLLGVSPATLSTVGGVALLYAGIPMMRGIEHVPPEDPTDVGRHFAGSDHGWRELLITPLAFPLSVGGATMALSVSSATLASTVADLLVLSLVAVVFGVVVGTTLYVGGALPGRLGPTGRTVLNRAGGILLTAIGVSLVVTNVTRLVVSTLQGLG